MSSPLTSTESSKGETVFGDYVLLERIGSGGMAEIFKARRSGPEGFQKTVVVKRILPAYIENSSFVSMLISEATVSAALHHSNVVQVYDLGEVDGLPFIAMEYVDGIDLLQLLKECARQKVSLPLELVLFICSEVAKGLDYAHHACNGDNQPLHVIHRDVSPSNILISRDGEVKITDFGVARFSVERGPVTRAGVLKGKMGYMSPEQVRGGLFDGRADLFSLGIVLFESMTLKRLFLGQNELETLINIRDVKVEERLKRHYAIVEPVLELLNKALHRLPDERFQRGLEFHRAIQDFLFEGGYRVDAMDLASFVQERLNVAMADPESTERFRRSQLTGQELREEATLVGSKQDHDSAEDLPLNTQVVSAPLLSPVTQVAIPRDAQEARKTGSHRAEMSRREESSKKAMIRSLEKVEITSDRFVAEELSQCIHHRETGVIHLESERGDVEVFLAGGVVRYLQRGDSVHPLEAYLVEEELVSSDDWARINGLLNTVDIRLVDALVQEGILRAEEVIRHLQCAYERAFLNSFSWGTGFIWFERGGRLNSPDRIPVELDASELLTEGALYALGEEGLLEWLEECGSARPLYDVECQGLRRLGHREKRMLSVITADESTSLSSRCTGRSRSDLLLIARLSFVAHAVGLLKFV